jgi:hypothetical protein
MFRRLWWGVVMMELLGWTVLGLGLWNLLIATVLWPLVRYINNWFGAWCVKLLDLNRPPSVELLKKLLGWWLARETLQRVLAFTMGLALLVVWLFIWGPAAGRSS